MKLTFYNNLEFSRHSYMYNLIDGEKKGTYYTKILNQVDTIINWLEIFLVSLKDNKTDNLLFPICRNIDFSILHTIKKEILIDFNDQKSNLITMKEYYKVLEEKEKEKKENVSQSRSALSSCKSRIDNLETAIIDKTAAKRTTQKIISFLITHQRKVDYFIIKEKIFKKYIPKNEINTFLSSSIDLPAYTRELYYENNDVLKYAKSVFLDKNLKNNKFDTFFENTNFYYIDKYNISSISELLNLYFNEIVKNKISLKKCKNCGKYFIAHKKQLYCDNPSPNNPNVTCRKLSDDMKEKENKLYEIYRKTYKTQHNKLNRYIHVGNIPEYKLKERFKKWNDVAILKRKTCKSIDEYKKWYCTSLNWLEDFK